MFMTEEQLAQIQARIQASKARVVRPLDREETSEPAPVETVAAPVVSKHLQITLPWPPSVNSYWRHPKTGHLAGRHLISREGRMYRAKIKELCWNEKQIIGRVSVHVEAYPPDNRRRDLDNIFKALLDSITHAALIMDDSYIDDLRIVRKTVEAEGRVVVTINALETPRSPIPNGTE